MHRKKKPAVPPAHAPDLPSPEHESGFSGQAQDSGAESLSLPAEHAEAPLPSEEESSPEDNCFPPAVCLTERTGFRCEFDNPNLPGSRSSWQSHLPLKIRSLKFLPQGDTDFPSERRTCSLRRLPRFSGPFFHRFHTPAGRSWRRGYLFSPQAAQQSHGLSGH